MQVYTRNTENYRGYTINIIQDTNPQNPSPRTEWDNLGTMVCWHNRYNLGDMKGNKPISSNYQESDYLFAEIAGINRESDYCMRIYDIKGYKDLSAYLYNKACKKAVILPLYLYDHSGITISTGKFSDTWDSGQIGWIYITHEKAKKEYGWKILTKGHIAKLIDYLIGEVEVYNQYLTGDVWGFEIVDPEDNDKDSCYSFYGDSGIAEAITDAKNNIDYYIKAGIKEHLNQLKVYIKNKVPLHIRKPLKIAS